MHPDRRRRGRAIRKQRRLARRPGYVTAAVIQAALALGTVGAQAFAASLGFGRAFAAMARLEEAHARLDMIARACSLPIDFERHTMTTVSITTSSIAPHDLVDHLISFAQELEAEGITASVALIRTCVSCGCTDDDSCISGCSWVSEVDDLCTFCDSPASRELLAQHAAERQKRIAALALRVTATETPLTQTNGAWS